MNNPRWYCARWVSAAAQVFVQLREFTIAHVRHGDKTLPAAGKKTEAMEVKLAIHLNTIYFDFLSGFVVKNPPVALGRPRGHKTAPRTLAMATLIVATGASSGHA